MSDEILSSKIKESDLYFTQEVFRRGVLEGVRHSTPSPETLVRLSKIEETLDKIMDAFRDHSKKSEERIEEIVKEFQEGMKDVKYITELLGNASFMKKFFISSGAVVTFGGATYLMIKSIIDGK